MNPVLKRLLKGVIAAALSGLITRELSFLLTFLSDPSVSNPCTALITGVLLAAEKMLPSNL